MTTFAPKEQRVGVREFRLKIGQHLDNVLRGVGIIITRQGRPIAVLMDYEEYQRLSGLVTERVEGDA